MNVVPGDRDGCACGDGRDGGDGGGAAPEEGGKDDGGQSGGVDGVGVEGFLEDGLGVEALVEGPEAEQDDGEPADDEDAFVRGVGGDVADDRCR